MIRKANMFLFVFLSPFIPAASFPTALLFSEMVHSINLNAYHIESDLFFSYTLFTGSCQSRVQKRGGMFMAAYMITYDLNATGQKYDEVIQAIKDSSTGAWCN